jgi:predicted metal-dependent hydrolase
VTGQDYDPRYVEYFERFNRQRFFEAHEVLEALWLPQRQGPNGAFYKGLIQLAGAFVHWQKNRPGPSAALLGLARANLRNYPALHDGLNVAGALVLVEEWLRRLQAAGAAGQPLPQTSSPQLRLESSAHTKDRHGGDSFAGCSNTERASDE